MMFDKKAQAREKTVKIIALLVSMIVLFLLVWQTMGYFIIETRETSCKLSVAKYALASEKTFSEVDINCPRNSIVFYEDRVEKNGEEYYVRYDEEGDMAFERKFDELNNGIVNYVLAQELASCWEAMGQGNFELFADPLLNLNFEFEFGKGVEVGVSNPCLIWDYVSFDKDISQESLNKPGFDNMGLLDYMKEEYPVDFGKEQDTYYDYIFLEQEKKWAGIEYGEYVSVQVDPDLEINPEEVYYIYFRAAKQSLWSPAAGAVSSLIPGLATDWYGVHISTIDELKQNCDYLYN
jgi:hypothetical protein